MYGKILQNYSSVVKTEYTNSFQKKVCKAIWITETIQKKIRFCLYYVRDWYKDNFKKYRLKIYKQTEHYIDKITQQLNENVLEHPIITRYISEHYEPSHPIKDDWELCS